jgi:hypothetical protein
MSARRSTYVDERPERRSGLRSRPRASRAWLAWWAGGGFRTAAARIADIGPGGVAVTTREGPTMGTHVLFGLLGARAEDLCAEAIVLGVSPTERGEHRLRLEFAGRCPEALMRWLERGRHAAL